MSPADQGELPATVQDVLRALLDDLDRLSSVLAERILTSQPGYVASAVERDALQQAARDNIRRGILRGLGELPLEDTAPDEARAVGAVRAAQGVPLEDVLNAYRLGGQLVWEEMLAAHDRHPDRDADALLGSVYLVWRESDLVSNALVQGYRAEEARLRRQDHQRQQATIDGLLAGRGADAAFAREAALVLDLPLDAAVMCIVALPADGEAGDVVDVAELTSMPRTVWTVRAGTRVGLVPADPALTTRLQQVLGGYAVGGVGVSPPVAGLADVPRGYRLAEIAARTAGTGQVHVLQDYLPEALLVGQSDLRQLLRERTVGCLDRLPAGERATLLDTLRALADSDWSATAAAARARCHRNTITYRLSTIERLHGRRIETGRDKLLWTLALLT